MKDVVFLETKNLFLRPLALEDLEGNYHSWLNDQEIVQYNSHGRFPLTLEKMKDYISSANNSEQIVMAIVSKHSNTHIGNISLQSINWVDRNVEIAFILGEKQFWGKGVMLEAGKAMIDHAFNSLNLHRVYCGTSSSNLGMQRLAKKLGMLKEGVRKEAIFTAGKYHDVIEFGLINMKMKVL